jgi:soluble lytic murein transglycosylase
VRRFTGGQPASAKGRFALARVLLAEGDCDGAGRQVRQAWQSEELSEHVDAEALAAFRPHITRQAQNPATSCTAGRGAPPSQHRA